MSERRLESEVVVGLTLPELERRIAFANAAGRAVASLSLFGAPDDVRYAVVLAPRDAPVAQRIVGDVAPGRLVPLVHAHRGGSWLPVKVAAFGRGPEARAAVVLERAEPGDRAGVTRLVAPRPLRDARGPFGETALDEGERDEAFVLDAAVYGDPGPFGAACEIVCVVASRGCRLGRRAASASRLAWAVHLDRSPTDGPPWSRSEPVATLSTCSRPVQTGRIDATWVWSLWRDDLIEPWPAPDPFARGERFAIDEGVTAEALRARLAWRREAEAREPVAIAAYGGPASARFDVLYGAAHREQPLLRQWAAAGAPIGHAQGAAITPLDRWMQATMERGGARHGQIAVVRGARTVFARACTLAESGYPPATLDQPMRLGSVTKAITAIAWMIALRAHPLPHGLDTPLGSEALLDLDAQRSGPLAAVTLRQLLQHDAGLPAWSDLRHEDVARPLSEASLAEEGGRVEPIAAPGELLAVLRRLPGHRILQRAPGGKSPGRFTYSNEGFILLGELLAKHVTGSAASLGGVLIEALLGVDGPASATATPLGPWLGAGRRAARDRGESPAHPLSPTWETARFAEPEGARTALASYQYNGAFLGGAAGLSLPVTRVARLLADLGPRPGELTRLTRGELDQLAAPADETAGAPAHGFHLGERGWWPTQRSGCPAFHHRFVRLAHNGRIDGGTSLLVYQMPEHASDDGDDTTLGVVVAFNSLFPLYEDPHGRDLFAILRRLEEAGALSG